MSKKSAAAIAAPPTFQVLELDVDAIVCGDNTRGAITRKSVGALAQTIETVGLLHPIVVEKVKNRWELVAGARRLTAFKVLERKRIPARVLEAPQGEQLSAEDRRRFVQLIENTEREDVDPVREAAAIAELRTRPGWTDDQIAATLGCSVSHVQRRARLATLSPAATAARAEGKPLAAWPIAWLEELALLGATDQADVVKSQADNWRRIRSLDTLRAIVRERLRTLTHAPWKLDDAGVLQGRPACTTCTEHTLAQPGLFVDEKTPAKLTQARCLNAECFLAKLCAFRASAIAAAVETYGKDVVLVHGEGPVLRHDADEEVQEVLDELNNEQNTLGTSKVEVLHSYQFGAAKKGDKGAKPAVIVTGKGVGDVRWIKDRTYGSSETRTKKPGSSKMTQGEKVKALAKRRARWIVLEFRKRVDAWEKKPAELAGLVKSDGKLLQIVTAWGCGPAHVGGSSANSYTLRIAKFDLDGVERRVHVLQGVLSRWVSELGNRYVNFAELDCVGEVHAICDVLGIDYASEYSKPSEEAIPVPRSWSAEKKKPAAAPAKKKPATKARRAKGAAAYDVDAGDLDLELEGRSCRVCSCVDERACEGGCAWVADPEQLGDLCSACEPAVLAKLGRARSRRARRVAS